MIKRFKYFIPKEDLIEISQGRMHKVDWFPRKPKDVKDILEVIIEVMDNKKGDKDKSPKQDVVSNYKKRQAPQQTIPGHPCSSDTGRQKNTRPKIIP